MRERLGAFAKGVAGGLALRHEHGSQYVSHHFQREVRFPGVASSPAFVRQPEGPVGFADITPWDRAEPDGCAERSIRVLKGLEPHSGSRLWVRRFDTVEELRLALLAFKQTHNRSWIIERHGYKTPAQVRADQLGQLPRAA
jgi:putative transposase